MGPSDRVALSPRILLPSSFCLLPSFHPLEHLIVLAVHAQAGVDLLGGGVAAIDVEANAADPGVRLREHLHLPVQTRVNTPFAEVGAGVDALDPPDYAIASVDSLVPCH